MKAPRIALVTCDRLPDLPPDEQLLVRALAIRGVRAEAAVWNNPAVRWGEFDAVILRSAWDYHLHVAAFFGWLDAVTAAGVPVWNPPPLLRWNAEKTYLQGLAARGVAVVPTRYVAAGASLSLASLLEETGWETAIVKPTISASAFETWRVERSDAPTHEARFQALVAGRGMMVQPYLAAFEHDGEWSLVFIAGQFSHAVLKRAARGDFRVQEEHGGSVAAAPPPAGFVDAARRVLDAVEGPWLYARVDGCGVDGTLVLSELELIEPTLYLDAHAEAAGRFARAIVESLPG